MVGIVYINYRYSLVYTSVFPFNKTQQIILFICFLYMVLGVGTIFYSIIHFFFLSLYQWLTTENNQIPIVLIIFIILTIL